MLYSYFSRDSSLCGLPFRPFSALLTLFEIDFTSLLVFLVRPLFQGEHPSIPLGCSLPSQGFIPAFAEEFFFFMPGQDEQTFAQHRLPFLNVNDALPPQPN
jgi:hypothetical protein